MGVAAQGIRYAAHGLVAAWADHDRLAGALLRDVTGRAAAVGRIVHPVRPGGPELARTVVSEAALGAGAAERELAAVAAVLGGEVRALLALLFDDPALAGAATVLPAPGSGVAGIAGTFPPGGPREYVRSVLTDHPSSWGLPVRSAAAAPVTGASAPPASVRAVADAFEPSLRTEVERMFAHPLSHAIQVHGPDVTDEALQARISWRKDPAGRTSPQHRWTLLPDDSVDTKHRVGATAGRFDTYEALAKPLKALIDATGGLPGLAAYLSTFRTGRVKIFVPAAVAGLEPGDTTGFRGAGARTADLERHWQKARDYAVDTGSAPMPIVATDQIAHGRDPGAAIILHNIGDRWVVVTCYPVPEQNQSFIRFEGPPP